MCLTNSMNLFRIIVLTAILSTLFAPALRAEAPLAADASIEQVLDALDQRGKSLKGFTAKLSDTNGDPDLGNVSTHTGAIWLVAPVTDRTAFTFFSTSSSSAT